MTQNETNKDILSTIWENWKSLDIHLEPSGKQIIGEADDLINRSGFYLMEEEPKLLEFLSSNPEVTALLSGVLTTIFCGAQIFFAPKYESSYQNFSGLLSALLSKAAYSTAWASVMNDRSIDLDKEFGVSKNGS